MSLHDPSADLDHWPGYRALFGALLAWLFNRSA